MKIALITGVTGQGGVLEAVAENFEKVINNSRKMSTSKQG